MDTTEPTSVEPAPVAPETTPEPIVPISSGAAAESAVLALEDELTATKTKLAAALEEIAALNAKPPLQTPAGEPTIPAVLRDLSANPQLADGQVRKAVSAEIARLQFLSQQPGYITPTAVMTGPLHT
jgi:hypothetical protein